MNKTDATTGRLVVVGGRCKSRQGGPSGFLCVDGHARGSLVDVGGPSGNARGHESEGFAGAGGVEVGRQNVSP